MLMRPSDCTKSRAFKHFLEVDLFGGGLHRPDVPQIGKFHVRAPRIDLFSLNLPHPIQAQADSLEIDGKIRTGLIRLLIEAESILRMESGGLYRAFFSAPESHSSAFSEASLSGRLRLEKYPLVEGSAVLGLDGGPLIIRGRIDMERGNGHLMFHSEADLNPLKEIADFSKYRFLQSIEFPKTSQLSAHLTIDGSFSFSHMDFSFSSDSLQFGGSEFSNFRMNGSIDPDFIRCSRIEFDQSGYQTEGSIQGDLATGQTRILLKGRLYPMQFNSILPNWWAKTWKDFTFFEQPPYGDVEFQTNWKERRLLFHYGAIAGNYLSYQGIDISEIRVRSWALPGFLELFEIESKRPEGKGTGSMQWTFRERKNVARFLDIATQFHLANLAALLGNEAASFVDDFKLTDPPLLQIEGILYNRNATPSHQRALRIQAESKSPFSYRQISFDQLALMGALGPNASPPIRFHSVSPGETATGVWNGIEVHQPPRWSSICLFVELTQRGCWR